MMQTTMIVLGVIIAVAGIIMFLANRKMKNLPEVPGNENILELTSQNFGHQTKNGVVLVDFWASWCAPCRMMAPVLNDMAVETVGHARIAKVNVDEHQTLAQKFKIRGIPTMVLLKDGVEVNRFVGVKSKEFLLNQIHQVIHESI